MSHPIVEAAKKTVIDATQTVVDTAAKIPLRKHHVKDKMDFRVKHLPEDFHRRYDETTHRIYSRHLKRTGHVSAAKSLANSCKAGGLFSFMLGFVYGLQYDTKSYGECYMNLRTAIVGLETVWATMYMIFLPDLWGNFMISA